MTARISAERRATERPAVDRLARARGAVDVGGDAACWAHEFDEYLGLSDVPAGGNDGSEPDDANANDAGDGHDGES